jgi:type I restriction enzyme S subunit
MSAIQQLLTDHIGIWTGADAAKRSGRGRASGNASSVYGIKKLRELILELAVRGKLVPQDANDEPASELLKRIQTEKIKLIKKGIIKKQKMQPDIEAEEITFELPVGWSWSRLDNISPMSLVDGDWIESKDQDPSGDIRLVQLADIGVGEFKDKSDRFINQKTFEALNCTKLEEGDILIARLPAPIGRACIFPASPKKSITVVDVAILRPLGLFCSEYMVNAINSKTFFDQVESYGKGATRFRIATGNLKSLLVPLPPLAEQHRIVTKVDELMVLCDQLETQHNNATEAHEKIVSVLLQALTQSADANAFADNWQRIAAHFDTLFTTEASIDALKQTLLQLAVMGKLVPQDANDEPASELLKKIRTEKDKLIKESKIKKDKPLPEITEEEKPFELPSGWEWVRLGEIIRVSSGDGLTAEQMDKSGAIPVYGGNGVNGYHSKGNITKQTLVIGRVGYYCGSIHMTPDIAWVTDNAFITRFSEENIYMMFLCWLLKITNLKENENATAQPVISGAKVYPIVVSLPPLAEQHRIVAKVDDLMALCDQLKARIGDAGRLQQKIADVVVEGAVAV